VFRPGGGASRLTFRRLLSLVEQLPPESRTKTAMRDDMDPFEIAAQVEEPRPGWGPWSHTDHLLAQIGERLDSLQVTLVRVMTEAKPSDPPPLPRPGVLTPEQIAELRAETEAPVVNVLEQERAERARAKAEAKRQKRIQQQQNAAAEGA
jgi:hypothetical protein